MIQTLLVDDEPAILAGLRNIIPWEKHGFTIAAQAQSGEEALNVLYQGNISLVIADIKMPLMTGIELLNEIRRLKLPTKVVILSGYDEFSYVKECLTLGIENYLLKPVNQDELTDTLEAIRESLTIEQQIKRDAEYGHRNLCQHIFARLLNGVIEDHEFMTRAKMLNLPVAKNHYVAILIRASTGSDLEVAASYFAQSLTDSEIIFMSADELVLIHHSDTPISTIKLQSIIEECNGDWFCVIGSVENRIIDLQSSYAHALTMLDYNFFLPKGTVIVYDDVSKRTHTSSDATVIDFTPLNNIFTMSVSQAMLAIDDFFDSLHSLKNARPSTLRSVMIELFFYLWDLTILPTKHFDQEKEQFTSSIVFGTLDDIKEFVRKIVVSGILWLEEERSHPVAVQILEYVQSRYHENISLKTTASHFYISPKYAGKLFKQHTGETFADYLCNLRISHAKRLLATTSMRSFDIAACVGFRDAGYFANVFKKVVGVYPSKFREISQDDK